MWKVILSILVVALLLFPTISLGRTWYIKADGTGDAPTIQAGVDSAGVQDTVLVAAGTYYERVSVPAHKVVAIIGESGAEQTIIDAQFEGRPMYCYLSDGGVILKGLTLTNGYLSDGGGGGLNWVGFACAYGWCEASNLIVKGNTTTSSGGGIDWYDMTGDAILHDCLVFDNEAVYGGGGIAATTGMEWGICIENNTVVGNSSPEGGAGITTVPRSFAFVSLRNNIVALNEGIGIYSETGGSGTVGQCNDVWGNAGGNFGGLLSDWTGTNGNISVDPLFCNPGGDDYTLASTSPCLPGNHPDGADCGLIGAYEQGCVATSVGPQRLTTWGTIKALYRR